MVHRRWLLQEELAMIGIGSTDRYSCVVVDGTDIGQKLAKKASKDARGWVAWPPSGWHATHTPSGGPTVAAPGG